jgi:recombination protein RecR
MSAHVPQLERVIGELTKLPGVGPKTAQRLAFHLLKAPGEDAVALAEAIVDLRKTVRSCRQCFNLAAEELCPICADPGRDVTILCVVEEPANVFALERTGAYRGLYHVLGGALSPLRDVGAEELHISELIERIRHAEPREIVLATNPNVEGEATAVYLSRLLQSFDLRITRLAQGLPAGGDLEFTDDLTLRRAVEGRRSF